MRASRKTPGGGVEGASARVEVVVVQAWVLASMQRNCASVRERMVGALVYRKEVIIPLPGPSSRMVPVHWGTRL